MKNKGGLVYSTNRDLNLTNKIENNHTFSKNSIISVCFEKKGRKGKGVTIIKDFPGNSIELALLATKIKKTLGIGGSIKNHEIILQGRIQEKIISIHKKDGYKSKKVGG
ncbi:MAG: translation initiation factor [Flavobacteriales bacterium]|nr:translation initiation factor [Flavobacteriales bacterium]